MPINISFICLFFSGNFTTETTEVVTECISPPTTDEGEDTIEFRVTKYHEETPEGWRLATVTQVQHFVDKVKIALTDKTWHTCSLLDGSISGSGDNYEIKSEVGELGHKVIVTGM